MDINKTIQEATDKFVAEKLPTMVEEKVSNMMNKVLEDIFGNWSDVTKQVKEVISKKLNLTLKLDEIDVVDYAGLVISAINSSLLLAVKENSIAPIDRVIKRTVGFVEQKEVYLEEIVEQVKEYAKEDSYDQSGRISLHVDYNDECGWWTVNMDIEGGKSKEECNVEFLVSEERNDIFVLRTKNHWRRYESGREEVSPASFANMKAVERTIFRYYVAGTKILDIDDYFDLEWSKYND